MIESCFCFCENVYARINLPYPLSISIEEIYLLFKTEYSLKPRDWIFSFEYRLSGYANNDNFHNKHFEIIDSYKIHMKF